MFKSKHSGWTWDLKRTPFGGGGGGFDPGSWVNDALSSAGDALDGSNYTTSAGNFISNAGYSSLF
jgi:hypothetical protein